MLCMLSQSFRSWSSCLLLVIFCLPSMIEVSAQDPPRDSLDRNYAEELPRIPPRSAAEALASFVVKSPYEIELVASEPQVVDPVAIDFDERGRIYVVEMRGYSEDAELNIGTIRLLEDRDGDGRYEHATIFVDGLSWPTALLCYDGGVFVGAAPDLWFFKDTTGDGRADVRKKIFTGFSTSNVQGLLNSFRWSLDGRVEAATSSSGAKVTCPSHPERKALSLRGRDFSFDPRTLEIRAESGGGQHGMCFDRWGTKFVCSNSNHLQQVMFEDRYVARNPYLAAPSPRAMIAADGPQAEVYRASPVEPWRIVRTRLRMQKLVPGPVEGGGRAAGYFTSATGLTIYLGDAWPASDRDMAIVGDVGSNIVHRKRLERADNSLLFTGKRVDEKSEFIASKDIWFRPVQFANGPDGGLYIIDMYRETIEHPASLHPIIKQHLDLTSGRDRGRIYRVLPRGANRRPLPKLDQADTGELVSLLAHGNEWHRVTAARLLVTHQKPQAVPLLRKLIAESDLPEARIRALYVLASMQALAVDTLELALSDDHAHVRRHAVRLSERLFGREPALRSRIARLVTDSDLRVRYQVAFSLGELSDQVKVAPLSELILSDGADRWMETAIRSSLNTGSGAVLARLAGKPDFTASPTGRRWMTALATQIGKQQRAEDIAAILKLLGNEQTSKTVAQQLMRGLAPRPGSALAKRLAAVRGGSAAEATRAILERALQIIDGEEVSAGQRAAAVRELALGKLDELEEVFAELLTPSQPADVQAAALATLGQFSDAAVAQLVIAHWLGLSPALRTRAGDLLASRPSWARALVEAMKSGTIPPGDVSTAQLKALAALGDPELTRQVKPLLAGASNPNRKGVVEKYARALKMKGDIGRGREVFKRVCAACHQVEGVGHAIGPNLAAMRNRGAEAILTNVLDPNREVNPEFLNYNVLLQDGRVLSGMITGESANSLVLKRADNATDTVLRIDIEALKSTGQSLMPEGLEKEVTVEQLADLLAFLLADR